MTIERNQVYKMDCIKGLQEMLQGGVQADCIITDPPYFINYKSNHRHNKDHKFCKTPQQMQQMAENLAKEKGVNLQEFMKQMGINRP